MAANLARLRSAFGSSLLLLEAGLSLAAARAALRLLPSGRVHLLLGELGEAPERALPENRAANVARVAWAVRAAARRLPWTSNCLPQAIVARSMLRRRGVPSTLHLGVRREQHGALEAHAWLRAGSSIVTGSAGLTGFVGIGSFR